MDGGQQLVGIGGLGLVAVNFWTGPQRQQLGNTLWNSKDPAAAHSALLQIGGELLLLGILTVIAGQSPAMGTGMGAIVAALWVLWGIHRYGTGAKPKAAPAVQPIV